VIAITEMRYWRLWKNDFSQTGNAAT